MSDASEIAGTVVDALVKHPDQKTIEVDTSGRSSSEVLAIIDAIYTRCEAGGVTVKGFKVDPMQIGLPANAEFLNGFLRDGRLIIVDLEVDDKVVVRRK